MQVNHELAQCTRQPRQLAAQHDEARARELRGGLEIHEAHGLADLEMLLRRREVARGAEAVTLDVVVLVLADRHVRVRRVRDVRERLVERGARLALGPLQRRRAVLEARHFGHQLLRARARPSWPWPGRSPSTGRCGAPAQPAGRRWRRGGARRGRSARPTAAASPRFVRPSSKASGLSRMKRMSCMGENQRSSC